MLKNVFSTTNTKDICRLCLLTRAGPKIEITGVILHKISTCLSLEIPISDQLPKQICGVCMDKIDDYSVFRQKVLENENMLITKLKNNTEVDIQVSIKQEIVDPDENTATSDKETDDNKDIKPEKVFIEINVDGCIKTERLSDQESPNYSDESDKEIQISIEPEKINPTKAHVCLTCSDKFTTQMGLLRHYNTVEKFRTNKTEEVDEGIEFSEVKKGDQITYVCGKCNKSYITRKSIRRHIQSHKQSRPFLCKLCGRTYKTASEIVRHGKVHDGTDYTCSYKCGYTSVYKHALKEHEKRHRREHAYKCNQCGKGFHVKTWFEQHQNVHENKRPYKCELCGVAFHMDRYLSSHRSTVHPNATKQNRYVCTICTYSCNSSQSLALHLKYHGVKKDLLCDVCGKAMRTNKQLNVHKRTHLGVKPYACETCNKSFTKKCHLTLHEKSTHSGERLQCTACTRLFTQLSSLNRHMRRRHKELVTHVCPKCNKILPTDTELIAHVQECKVVKADFGELAYIPSPPPPDMMHTKDEPMNREDIEDMEVPPEPIVVVKVEPTF